jgi:hypothetical protein
MIILVSPTTGRALLNIHLPGYNSDEATKPEPRVAHYGRRLTIGIC